MIMLMYLLLALRQKVILPCVPSTSYLVYSLFQMYLVMLNMLDKGDVLIVPCEAVLKCLLSEITSSLVLVCKYQSMSFTEVLMPYHCKWPSKCSFVLVLLYLKVVLIKGFE